jgi:beta-glucosidase
VVINQSGTPVEMPWADQASTLVQYWFSGMEGGNAIAAVLAGDVNPSGKLPVTFPRQLSDTPADTLHDYNGKKEAYAEGVLVGYRWYDAKSIAPLFPFGYGLSYTTFSISDLKLSAESIHSGEPVTVTATVTNSGKVPGAEVVQLYIGDSSATVMRPPKELKGFQKVTLQPGESKAVQFDLDSRAFSYWDEKAGDWKIDPGLFQIRVGTSSRDLPLEKDLAVK